jgi:hypothetical protein
MKPKACSENSVLSISTQNNTSWAIISIGYQYLTKPQAAIFLHLTACSVNATVRTHHLISIIYYSSTWDATDTRLKCISICTVCITNTILTLHQLYLHEHTRTQGFNINSTYRAYYGFIWHLLSVTLLHWAQMGLPWGPEVASDRW